jgi:hypothetical protein
MINKKTKKILWSKEDTLKLFTMAKNNVCITEIYSAFPDRKESAINNKLHRQGFSAAKTKK